MNAVDIIAKKRDSQTLSSDELKFFVDGYTRGDIPDYQASAWCMAVVLNGMSDEEATAYTLHMASPLLLLINIRREVLAIKPPWLLPHWWLASAYPLAK